ncbi:MAG TPA: (2Fe-2S)-binding protein [Blastocatellia bacterium]|nr:(2Fe-2S)-binding protein [Blastocatellia bacterium]
MPESITLRIDGVTVKVPAGSMVSAAIIQSGRETFRRSVTRTPRGPLCGMGICFECRVTINGRAHCRSCQIPCQEGMEIQTEV